MQSVMAMAETREMKAHVKKSRPTRNKVEDMTRPLSPASLEGLEPRPMDWASSTCGVYLLCNGDGAGIAVFKPQDEEKIPEHAK
jgi:hypothetical protein